MQPVQVYATSRRAGQVSSQRSARPYQIPARAFPLDRTGAALVPCTRGVAGPRIPLSDARIHRARSRMRRFSGADWNGYIEITDECPLGLALFEIAEGTYASVNISLKLNTRVVQRRLRVVSSTDGWRGTRLNIFRTHNDTSMPEGMMQRLDDLGVEKYVSEYALVGALMRKIRDDEAVRQRWIPAFSPPIRAINGILNNDIFERLLLPPFEVRGSPMPYPRTIAQWFLAVIVEKVRRSTNPSVGLRTLLYCITWCARLIHDRDYARLEQSAVMIKAWLLQGTCGDCVYKYLRELREDYAFEYVFNVADSFSRYFRLPDLRLGIQVMECQNLKPQDAAQNAGFLRTIGRHSFLTSPYARTSLEVRIQVLEGRSPKIFYMTGRQTSSLLLMLDMHARLLRAEDWSQGSKVYMACMAERRANDGVSRLAVLKQLTWDMIALRKISHEMMTVTSHFAPVLFEGKISTELSTAYCDAMNTNRSDSAHSFIISHSFLRAPSPDLQCYADERYDRFQTLDSPAQDAVFETEHTTLGTQHPYEFQPEDIDLAEKWGILLPDEYESVEEILEHGAEFRVRERETSSEESENEAETHSNKYDDSHATGASSQTSEEASQDSLVSGEERLPLELDAVDLEALNDLKLNHSTHMSEYRSVASEIASTESTSSIIIPDDDESISHLSVRRMEEHE